MKLSSFSVILTFVVLMVVGVAMLPLLDVGTEPPSRQGPQLTIRYGWPRVSAKVVEQSLTTPIEGMISAQKGVESVSSRSCYGSSEITVRLKKDADVSSMRFAISSLLRQSYPQLPKGITYPVMEGGGVSDVDRNHKEQQLLLTYQVNADMQPEMMKQIVSGTVVRRLAQIDDVSKVEVTGVMDRYLEVGYDPVALSAYGITAQDMKEGISHYLGKDEVVGAFNLHSVVKNSLTSAPIKKVGGKMVYLNDLAAVNSKRYEPTSFYRVNGLNTVYVNVYASSSAHILHLSSRVQEEMETIKSELRRPLYIHLSYDIAQQQRDEMTKLIGRSLVSLLFLLAFVFAIYRDVKYLLVIMSALLANILLAVIAYCVLGIKLHVYSLAGITVSLGIIIDSVIVMADHYGYYHNRKAFLSILAAMLTTIGALLIVFFLPSEMQVDLYDFALIVIVNLVVALLVALFFVPAVMDQWHCLAPGFVVSKRRHIVRWNHFYRRYIFFVSRHKWVYALVLVWAFGIPFQLLPEDLRNEKTDFLSEYLGGTIGLFSDYLHEHAQTGNADDSKVLHIQALLPVGGTAVQLNEKMVLVEEMLKKYPEVKEFVTRINGREGNIEVKFKKGVATSFPYRLESKVIGKIITIGGADWSTYGVSERGFSNSLDLQYRTNRIKVSGYNYAQLYRLSEDMVAYLGKNPRVQDLVVETPGFEHQEDEFFMRYDREKMSLYGITPWDVQRQLSGLLSQDYVGTYRDGSQSQDVYLKPMPRQPYDLWHVENSQLAVDSAQLVPSEVMDVQRREAKEIIPKEKQEYVLNVAFNVLGSYTYTAEYMDSVMAHFERAMPVGFRCEVPQYYNPVNEGSNYGLLLLVAVLIFFICSVVFESLGRAWVVVAMIPVSLMGAFLTFVLTGVEFGSGGFASLVLLSGIVVNSSIYILCQYQQIRNLRHRDALGAYMRAFNVKLIPIMLTVVSTIIGLIPFFWEQKEEPFWFSFATGVTGGLLFSIPVLVFIMPLFMKFRAK